MMQGILDFLKVRLIALPVLKRAEIVELLGETGAPRGFCLEWYFDSLEHREARQP